MGELTSHQVAELIGVKYRTMMDWVENDLLHPEKARAGKGPGKNQTAWRAKDLREASVLAACRRAGFTLQEMRRAMGYLRSLGHNPLSRGSFVALNIGDGDRELVKVCKEGEALALLRNPGQVLLPLPDWPGGDELAENTEKETKT